MLEKLIKNRIKLTLSGNFKRFLGSLPPEIPKEAMSDVERYLSEANVFFCKAEIFRHELEGEMYDSEEERIKLCNLIAKSEYLADHYLEKALNRRNSVIEEGKRNEPKK